MTPTSKSFDYDEYKKEPLQVTTINLFKNQLKIIDKIKEAGFSSSRSELIRKILDQYLRDYYKMLKNMELLTPEQIKIMGE